MLTLQTLFQLRSNSLKGVLQSHFGVHRELGLYNDDQAHYNQNLWWYVWEIPVFVLMGITQVRASHTASSPTRTPPCDLGF